MSLRTWRLPNESVWCLSADHRSDRSFLRLRLGNYYLPDNKALSVKSCTGYESMHPELGNSLLSLEEKEKNMKREKHVSEIYSRCWTDHKVNWFKQWMGILGYLTNLVHIGRHGRVLITRLTILLWWRRKIKLPMILRTSSPWNPSWLQSLLQVVRYNI